jgi:single-stranded-DNA-specific exonuclease
VLYQVITAYTRVHAPEKAWEIHLLRLFAGLGTVSDVMPLLFENRQLVRDSVSLARLLRVAAPKTIPNRFGGFDPDPDAIDIEQSTLMQLLRMDDHHPVFLRAFEGFALILKAFAQHGKIRDVDDLDEGFYGFYLAPAMNSPRRIGVPLDECFTVFTAADPEEKLNAAHTVIANNELRKEMVVDHLAELVDGDQPLAPWVYFSSAPGGMFGLLANQMMQLGGHPVVVVTRPDSPSDYVSGSGRAPEWFNIISSLEPYDGLAGIGHQQACGVRVQRAELLDTLVDIFREATALAAIQADADGPKGDLVLGPGQDCDAGLDDLTPLFDLVRRVEALKPYGHGFVEPVFEIALEPLGLRVERIGSSPECEHSRTGEFGFTNDRGFWVCVACKKHLRLITRSGLAVLWWNSADDKYDEIKAAVENASRTDAGTLRFTAKLQLNTFRDITRVQAVVVEQLPDAD